MKLLRLLSCPALLSTVFLTFFSFTTYAQTARIPARVLQAVDFGKLFTLRGNTHPLARPEFDQGVGARQSAHGTHPARLAALAGAGDGAAEIAG